jgi:hypothetical protein
VVGRATPRESWWPCARAGACALPPSTPPAWHEHGCVGRTAYEHWEILLLAFVSDIQTRCCFAARNNKVGVYCNARVSETQCPYSVRHNLLVLWCMAKLPKYCLDHFDYTWNAQNSKPFLLSKDIGHRFPKDLFLGSVSLELHRDRTSCSFSSNPAPFQATWLHGPLLTSGMAATYGKFDPSVLFFAGAARAWLSISATTGEIFKMSCRQCHILCTGHESLAVHLCD